VRSEKWNKAQVVRFMRATGVFDPPPSPLQANRMAFVHHTAARGRLAVLEGSEADRLLWGIEYALIRAEARSIAFAAYRARVFAGDRLEPGIQGRWVRGSSPWRS